MMEGCKHMIEKIYALQADSTALFNNHACFCIGTGRMGLALQQEYMDQLKKVQREIGFSHIRGHGLFCDDMAIYHPYTDEDGVVHECYNFTYLDRVMDADLPAGLIPFLELGFMPKKMASGEQTIFYWQGNTTPPADHEKWAAMIRATIRHLADRYGEERVAAWPVEVWNEPNLPGFWKDADQEAYLKLYDASVRAVKEALPQMRVGGPAVCGGSSCIPWIRAFLDHCRDEKVPVDFLTRHIYMGQAPTRKGRYLYQEMCDPAYSIGEAEETRRLIDSYPEFKGMEMHITEYNTSYNPFCPTHDTVYNAALIAGMLAGLGDTCASYSYWTFGDVFEEVGVPDRPFHGGFGLLANDSIPKPTYWTYVFFSRMQGKAMLKTNDCVVVRDEKGGYRAVMWNLEREEKQITVKLPETKGKWAYFTRTVDEESGNPLKVWHDLGEPASLTPDQKELLLECARPRVESGSMQAEEGLEKTFTLRPNAVLYAEIACPVPGFSYAYEYPGCGR